MSNRRGRRQERPKLGPRGYDFSRLVSLDNIKNATFNFGPRTSEALSVDATLAKLFECLTVECSGILVHPQWKHFRHITIQPGDQYRLSNGIWRSWHIQFQKGKKPRFCQFDISPGLDHHKRQHLAVVLEGKYWKRKTDAVAREYRKWRVYHMEKIKRSGGRKDPFIAELLKHALGDELGDGPKSKPQAMQVEPPRGFMQPLDEIPDTFFAARGSPGTVPYAYTRADVVLHPNLEMLNPTLDELLDKLEPMEVMLSRSAYPAPSSSFFTGTGTSQSPFHTTPPPLLHPTSLKPGQPSQPQQQSPFLSSQLGPPLQPPSEQFSPTLLSQLTSPPKPIPQNQSPFSSPINFPLTRSGLPQFSPSPYLNMPADPGKSREPQMESSMEIGTPQMSNFAMKPEPHMDDIPSMQTCLHEQTASNIFNSNLAAFQPHQSHQAPTMPGSGPPPLGQDYATAMNHSSILPQDIYGRMGTAPKTVAGERGVVSLLNQLFASEAPPAALPPVRSPPMGGTSLSHVTSPALATAQPMFQFPSSGLQQQQMFDTRSLSTASSPSPSLQTRPDMLPPASNPFIRVSSAGNLGIVTTTPRPSPVKQRSEPSRILEEQVRKLSEQHERQMKEIEQQQTLAQQQYMELLQQYLRQTSGKTSEQQQQVLQTVLSDPGLVSILRDALLSVPSPARQEGGATPTPPENLMPVKVQETSPSSSSSGPQDYLVSPTHLAKATGVSDFQSRLVVAAAKQANGTSMSGGLSFTQTPSTSASATAAPFVMSSFATPESDASPRVFALNQMLRNPRGFTSEEKEVHKELRRQSHITAEQKRRGNIKQGFDQLQSLVVNISQYPSGKVSKATVLEKTLEHIHHTHQERESRERQIDTLRREIEELNSAISRCQEQLPASGAPVTRQRFEENRQRFREYVQRRTQQNYKFWIFSIILRQLFESYNSMVSTGSQEELCHTVLAWFEQNCTLPALRPIVMNSLRELSMKTSILSNPSQVPRQLAQYAKQELQQDHSPLSP